MATPVSYKLQNIDYIRLSTIDLVTKSQPAFSLFPENSEGTYFSINVSSTTVNIRYISTSITTNSYSYIGKTVEDLCLEINSDTLPIKATPNIRNRTLSSGDIFLGNTSSYFKIPDDFYLSERLLNNGIVVRSKFYTVKHNSLSNFNLLHPYESSLLLSWNPVITNSSFILHKNGKAYRYAIPEYENQNWSVKYGKPFKDVIGEQLTLVKKNVYRVSRTPLYWNGENVKLYNNDLLISSSIIEDIDVENGLIYFSDNTTINENSRIDYTFIENNYEYPYLNINCHITQNPFLINKFVVLYAIPLEGIDFTINKRTIYHAIGDSVDEAISSIPYYGGGYDPIIIGAYGCHQVIPGDTLKVLDTRVLGGGLIDSHGLKSPSVNSSNILEIDKEAVDVKNLFKESRFFYDIGTYDGELYPGAGSVVVELPNQLKEKFSHSDIEAGVSKFMGAGILPVISYYDRDLPAISGISTQVSLLLNGSLTENTYSYSGSCWNRFPIYTTLNPSTGDWSEETLYNNIITIDGTGVIRNKPEYGTRQSYLKSTPDAGIEFYSRDVQVNNNSIQNTYTFSPWKKQRLYDTRDVSSGQLRKGWVYFEPQQHSKEYSRVRVNSPLRLDSTGIFRNTLSEDIFTSHKALSGNFEYSEELDIDINGSIETFLPLYIKTRIGSLSEGTTVNIGDYLGGSSSSNYVYALADSSLGSNYSGLIESFGKTLLQAFGTGEELRFYSQALDSFSYHYGNYSGVDLTTFYNQITSYASWRKNLYGTGDYIFNFIGSSIQKVNSGNAFLLSNGYMPTAIHYEYNNESISIGYTAPVIPELSGFSEAEIVESNNNDFDYLVNAKAILLSSKLIHDFSGATAVGLQIPLVTCWSGVDKAVGRAERAITYSRTNNGNPVVQHWYNPYNRYGKYAGNLTDQIISSVESLYFAQTGGIGLTYNTQSGIDVYTLEKGLGHISNILSYASSGFLETITNGGLLDDYTATLLRSYGWYVNNFTNYKTHIQNYNPSYSPTDHRSFFSGIFHTGLYTLIKGMTTTNGDIFETTIVDGDPGPFQVYVPSRIFAALGEACEMDKSKYLPLTEAVYNTVKNNYSVNGYYYADPLKILDIGTYEDVITPYLVRLYDKL